MIDNNDFEVKVLLKFNNNSHILLSYVNINTDSFNIE